MVKMLMLLQESCGVAVVNNTYRWIDLALIAIRRMATVLNAWLVFVNIRNHDAMDQVYHGIQTLRNG